MILVNEKILKIFWPQIWAWTKKEGCPDPHPWQIPSPECLVKEKILKTFWLSNFVMTKNRIGTWTLLFKKFRVQSAYCKWKKFSKLFDLKFGDEPKKEGAQTPTFPPTDKFRVLEHSGKGKNSWKHVWTSNLEWPKKVGTWTFHYTKFRVQSAR